MGWLGWIGLTALAVAFIVAVARAFAGEEAGSVYVKDPAPVVPPADRPPPTVVDATQKQCQPATPSGHPRNEVTFEAFMDEQAAALEGTWFSSSLAGVSYRNDDKSSRQHYIHRLASFERLSLIPEPDNVYDKYAVRVETLAGNQVGFLHGRTAREVSQSFEKGDLWFAYVHEVTGQGRPVQGVNIGLLRYDPKRLARPQEQKDLERSLESTAARVGGSWKYIRLVKTKALNEDGVDRRELLSHLAVGEAVNTVDVTGNNGIAQIQVSNSLGQVIGYLERRHAREVLDDARAGHRFALFYRGQSPDSGGKTVAHFALLRLGLEASAIAIAEKAREGTDGSV